MCIRDSFLHEHPSSAASWGLPEMRELLSEPQVGTVVGHMCRFGMRVSEPVSMGVGGPLVRKPTRWASSAPEVLKR
eukprot:10424167-Alexandrium_andersonii.AAC.1